MMDSAQILRQALQSSRLDVLQNEAYSNAQFNKAVAESGEAMGFSLEVMEDPMAELMDSMEELSFQFEEKEMKTVGERKLGVKKRPPNSYVAAVEKWVKVLPDMPGGLILERLLRQLRQQEPKDSHELLMMMEEESEDPSHQFAMLDVLEKAFGPEEAKLKALLAAARQELEQTKGAEVRAGLNLAEEINTLAKTPEEMQTLRELYRGEIIGFKSPQDCFRSLLATRGIGELSAAIEFLIRGCGIDLSSSTPSQDPEALRHILGDLQAVQVLRTVLDESEALIAKMAREFGERSRLDPAALCSRLMDLTEMPFVNAANIAQLLSSCGLLQLLAKIYFNTELITIIRGFSPRLFEEEDGRQRLEDAAQEHLDGLIDEQAPEDDRQQEGGAR